MRPSIESTLTDSGTTRGRGLVWWICWRRKTKRKNRHGSGKEIRVERGVVNTEMVPPSGPEDIAPVELRAVVHPPGSGGGCGRRVNTHRFGDNAGEGGWYGGSAGEGKRKERIDMVRGRCGVVNTDIVPPSGSN
jgi:hypothetical protein